MHTKESLERTKEHKQRLKEIANGKSKYKPTKSYPTINFSFRQISNVANLVYYQSRGGETVKPKRKKKTLQEQPMKTNESQRKDQIVRISLVDDDEGTKKSFLANIPSDDESDHEESQKEDVQLKRKQNAKFLGNSLIISNNEIESLEGFAVGIRELLFKPQQLSWIDLSFNLLSSLRGLPTDLPLRVLYIHGNQIEDIRELAYLRQFKKLQSLTVHGNPFCEEDYKYFLIALLPQIKKLDFSVISYKDRDTADTASKIYRWKSE